MRRRLPGWLPKRGSEAGGAELFGRFGFIDDGAHAEELMRGAGVALVDDGVTGGEQLGVIGDAIALERIDFGGDDGGGWKASEVAVDGGDFGIVGE